MLLYHFIFIAPLLIMLLDVHLYTIKKRKLRRWKREKLIIMNLIEGLSLLFLGACNIWETLIFISTKMKEYKVSYSRINDKKVKLFNLFLAKEA